MFNFPKNSGFISMPILIAILIGTTFIAGTGGYYVATQMKATQTESVNINESAVEIVTDDLLAEEIDNTPTSTTLVLEKTEIPEEPEKELTITLATPPTQIPIEVNKPQITNIVTPSTQAQEIPVTSVSAPAPPDPKLIERKLYDQYSITNLKVMQELGAASIQIGDAIGMVNSNPEIAKSYADEALKLCDSAHKINSDNTPPQLPFWDKMYELNKIYTSRASLCKQQAIVVGQMATHSLYGERISDVAKEAIKLGKKELELNEQGKKQFSIINEAKEKYFQS